MRTNVRDIFRTKSRLFLEMRLFKARLLMFVNFSCKWDGDSIIYKTYMYIFNFIIRFLCSEIYFLFQGLSQYLISWKMMRVLKEQWKITRQGWNYLNYRLTTLESFWYSRTFFKGLGDLENEVKFFSEWVFGALIYSRHWQNFKKSLSKFLTFWIFQKCSRIPNWHLIYQ